MKDAEDEAFDELARRQGGGFPAKRKMAADKLREPVDIASIIACREMLDAQPVPARVQYMIEEDDDIQDYKRPWVGLTEEDFSAINQSCLTKLQAATSAESILKKKNS